MANLMSFIVEIISAATENPFPVPLQSPDLAKPIQPNIQPSKGIKKEHINPAIAILFVFLFLFFVSMEKLPENSPQNGQI